MFEIVNPEDEVDEKEKVNSIQYLNAIMCKFNSNYKFSKIKCMSNNFRSWPQLIL